MKKSNNFIISLRTMLEKSKLNQENLEANLKDPKRSEQMRKAEEIVKDLNEQKLKVIEIN